MNPSFFRPEDWQRVRNAQGEPGLKDFYANLDTGEIMTRRQYLNLYRGVNVEQYVAAHKEAARASGARPLWGHNGYTDAIYQDYRRAYRQRHPGQKAPGFKSREFQDTLDQLNSPRSKAGKGRKAQALRRIGRKRANDYHDVGES